MSNENPTWSRTCTTLDHIYPVTKFGKPCYCGARVWGGRTATPVRPSPPDVIPPSAFAIDYAQKIVDKLIESGVVLTTETESPRGAQLITGVPEGTVTAKDIIVQLQFKGLSKNGKTAIYTGAANALRFPVGAFEGNTAPPTLEITGVAAKAEKTPVAKLTPEERKALRAAKPKPTLAEKVAAYEAKLAKLRAAAEAEAAEAAAF